MMPMSRVLQEGAHHRDLSRVIEGEVIDEWTDMLHRALACHHALQNGDRFVTADYDVALEPQLHRRKISYQLPECCPQTLDTGVRIYPNGIFQNSVIGPESQPAIFVVIAQRLAVCVDRRDNCIGVWHFCSLLAVPSAEEEAFTPC